MINYDNSIISITNSILKYFDILNFHDSLGELDEILKNNKYKNIIIFLIDGLGSYNLNYYLNKSDFLRKNKIKDLTTVYPPTTTTATISFLTGLLPTEHNWIGWNMYFKDTDEEITLFKNKTIDNLNPKLDISDRYYMNYNSIIDLINKNKLHKAYHIYPNKTTNTCLNTDNLTEKIKYLCKNNEKKLIYAHIKEPDSLMHKHGIYSNLVKKSIKNINDKIEALSKNLKNSLIVVTSNHGLVNTNTFVLKKDFKDLYDLIDRCTIEARTCGIKLKNINDSNKFEYLFDKYLKNDFKIIKVDDISNYKLFGNTYSSYLEDTIGDYLLIATSNKAINLDENTPIFKANHAGYTKEELTIPLILIDCK